MNADHSVAEECPTGESVCDDPEACEAHAACRLTGGWWAATTADHRAGVKDDVTALGIARVLDLAHEAGCALDARQRSTAAAVLYRVAAQSESIAAAICRGLPRGEWRAVERAADRGRRWRE